MSDKPSPTEELNTSKELKSSRKVDIRERLRFFPRYFWPLMVLFLLIAYRILGLEGESVLLGLSCRNVAFLIMAVILTRYAIKKRKEKTFFPLGLTALISATFLTGAFMYLQANVVLDMIVVPRVATLSQCQIHNYGPWSLVTGFSGEIRGINANDYEKRLPMTPFQQKLVEEELKHYENVHVEFYEHVRRIVIIRTRYFDPDLVPREIEGF